MSDFGNRLKLMRERRNISPARLAQEIGTSVSSIYMYERGERLPRFETVEALADVLNCDYNYLLGKTDIANPYEFDEIYKRGQLMGVPSKRYPIIGTVACGDPITANREYDEYFDFADIGADYCLRCRGDSMLPVVSDGDIVFCRSQSDVEDGQMAAVIVEDEATLKRVYKYPDKLVLMPENSAYKPIIYTPEDAVSINIIGLAVRVLTPVR